MTCAEGMRYVTYALLTLLAVLTVQSATMACDCECPVGTGTPGYWMNHPEAWPVEEITIGGITYLKDDAIYLIGLPVQGDKTLTLFPALVAAKLNVLIGNCSCCIDCVIDKADAWMALYPPGSDVRANEDPWQVGECGCSGEYLYKQLDCYNNGLLCAPSRDELENDD